MARERQQLGAAPLRGGGLIVAPVIGIAACLERARWSFWDQRAHLVADSYVSALASAGAVSVLLPVTDHDPAEILSRVDALVLIGGADIDPDAYNAVRDPRTEATYTRRDEFELALTNAALERGLPFLGICRGMQILNVARGGTLCQHLTDAEAVTTHRRALGTFEGTERSIILAPGSLAARAVGGTVHIGHCHHHQAIDQIGHGLVVSGRAEDGVPEAIEDRTGQWVLGVQWHPEAGEKLELFHSLVRVATQRVAAEHGAACGARMPRSVARVEELRSAR